MFIKNGNCKECIEFVVPGDPMGKERPRVVNINGMHKSYTPAKTMSYEAHVRTCWALDTKSAYVEEGSAIKLTVRAFFKIPKSYTKKRRAECLSGGAWVKKKPDWDNIGKIVSDALIGYAWEDDNHVAYAVIEKHWTDGDPETLVKIEAIG